MDFIDRATEPYRLLIEFQYNHFISKHFTNEWIAEIAITFFLSTVFYWIIGLIFFAIDLTEKPQFIYRYKIQVQSSQISAQRMWTLVKQVLFNQILQLLVSFVLIPARSILFPGMINRTVPTLSRLALDLLVFNLVREAALYYIHRTFHHPALYKYVHKVHHQWQTPVALTAIYCHPIEHLGQNLLPVLLGPAVMASHNLIAYLWIGYVVFESVYLHCGYQLPGCPISPVFHDFHHLKFNVNYGVFGLFDWLHGTDEAFRKSPFYQLQKAPYFSFKPPVELLCDAKKMK